MIIESDHAFHPLNIMDDRNQVQRLRDGDVCRKFEPSYCDLFPSKRRTCLMPKPTVGRVVWYYQWTGMKHRGPLKADVAHVHSDTMVNVGVTDEMGEHFGRTSVRFVQANEEVPQGDYCCWPTIEKTDVQRAAESGYTPGFGVPENPSGPR